MDCLFLRLICIGRRVMRRVADLVDPKAVVDPGLSPPHPTVS
jgi:hypothetical protein